MVRKISLVLAALLVVGAAFAVGAATASSGIAAPTEITVLEHATHDKVVDVGKKGDSTGDIFTYHNDLYDETDTTKVGGDKRHVRPGEPESRYVGVLVDDDPGGRDDHG